MTARQEAILDLAVEQALSPALAGCRSSFVGVMLEEGIPLEAILTELFLSGEVERTYRLLRLEGYAAQMEHHSPASQYGQLSRVPRVRPPRRGHPMREIVDGITTVRFADEWDAERDAGFPEFRAAQGRGRRARHEGVRAGPPPPARRARRGADRRYLRSRRLRSLPVGSRGSASTKRISRGHLKWLRRSRV